MTDQSNQSAGWRMSFAIGSLVLACLLPVYFMVAALGSKWELWSWQFGLGVLTFEWAPILIGLVALISIAALITALIKAPRKRPTIIAGAALFIVVLAGGRFFGGISNSLSLPPLHDIQTDWEDPIMFSDGLMTVRGQDSNPVLAAPIVPDAAKGRWPGTQGRLVSELQEEAESKRDSGGDLIAGPYPLIEPLVFSDKSVDEVYLRVLAQVEERGWEVVTHDPANGRIEATETSGWFGFKDDVAILIRPYDDGTRVDMRSTSRVGLSDLGANARRVTSFLEDLDSSL